MFIIHNVHYCVHIYLLFVRAGLTAGNGISTKHKGVFAFVWDRCTVTKASTYCSTN